MFSFVDWLILLARASFIGSFILANKIEAFFSSVLVSLYNEHCRDLLDPALQPFASRLYFPKLITFYMMAIVANLAQMFVVSSYGFSLVVVVVVIIVSF